MESLSGISQIQMEHTCNGREECHARMHGSLEIRVIAQINGPIKNAPIFK